MKASQKQRRKENAKLPHIKTQSEEDHLTREVPRDGLPGGTSGATMVSPTGTTGGSLSQLKSGYGSLQLTV